MPGKRVLTTETQTKDKRLGDNFGPKKQAHREQESVLLRFKPPSVHNAGVQRHEKNVHRLLHTQHKFKQTDKLKQQQKKNTRRHRGLIAIAAVSAHNPPPSATRNPSLHANHSRLFSRLVRFLFALHLRGKRALEELVLGGAPCLGGRPLLGVLAEVDGGADGDEGKEGACDGDANNNGEV